MESHIYRHTNAIEGVIGQVFKCIEKSLQTSSFSFLKMVLESHHDRPRSLPLMMGDKKAFYYLLLLLNKAIVILGEAIAVDVFG